MFNNPTIGQMNYNDVVKTIVDFVSDDSNYELAVGTDSAQKNNKHVFVRAISIYQNSNGGRIFYDKQKESKSPDSIRSRLIEETKRSIKLAKSLRKTFLNQDFLDKIDLFQVHVDIGINGMFGPPMRESLKAMVKQANLKPSVKPESYGASIIADRFV